MRPLVYIACPISNPPTEEGRKHNFDQAAAMQRLLMKRGAAVTNPALTMLLPGAWDIPWEIWVQNSLPQVAVADAVLRLPGKSRGADIEVAFANGRGIRVFEDEDEMLAALGVTAVETIAQ